MDGVKEQGVHVDYGTLGLLCLPRFFNFNITITHLDFNIPNRKQIF